MAVKRIGFIDHRLDNFHAEVYLKALRGPLAARGYEVAGATALEPTPSCAWAAERGVAYFDSIEELGRGVDYLMILAPSRPDVHLELCEAAFPLGLPTFVDKTFAPNESVACQIFALADANGVAVQTTSALRSTAVQRRVGELPSAVKSMTVYSSGTSFEEYGIHPLELVVSCLGPDAEAVMRLGGEVHPQFVLRFSEDRAAMIDFSVTADSPFATVVSTESGHEYVKVDGDRLFIDAAASILDFFDAGRPLVDRRETLMIRRIMDRAMSAEAFGQFASLADKPTPVHELRAPHWRQDALKPNTPGDRQQIATQGTTGQ